MQLNVLEYLEGGAARNTPDKVAIVGPRQSYTFAEVERFSKTCGAMLIARADVLHEPIAVYLPKSPDVIFADLGILYSGNIYLNLDVKSPALRVKAILDQSRPVLIVCTRTLAPSLEALGITREKLFFIEDIYGVDGESASDDKSPALWKRLQKVVDTDPLCIVNTSGSTGIPKGVVLNHRGTIDFMDWCFDRLKLTGGERIGSLSPFHFDIYALELNYCLAKGATMVIIPDEAAIFPARLVEFLAAQAISFIFWVPSIMVNISNQGLLGQFDLSSLKTVFFAGEVFPMKHLNNWRRALPAARFVNLYGPIEITVDCTYFVVDREFADDEALPIGFPCRNTGILLLNERDEACAPGERGELCVRGSSLAMGYWNDPEKTAKAFVQNPLNTRYPEIIYRTGDIAYVNERGEIMLVGRKDFQIKHMGYRIELQEIEYQVLSIAGIANACVLYNRAAKEITLYYETRDRAITPAAIRLELLKIFPKYMLPAVFHKLDELPRNPNGKIDRNALNPELAAIA
jgi:amino acid adenylation domain-containing protein